MHFDRFDICEAYLALEMEWNFGGWISKRPSSRRHRKSIGFQLHNIGFRPGDSFSGYESLTENGREIYDACVVRWGLR